MGDPTDNNGGTIDFEFDKRDGEGGVGSAAPDAEPPGGVRGGEEAGAGAVRDDVPVHAPRG